MAASAALPTVSASRAAGVLVSETDGLVLGLAERAGMLASGTASGRVSILQSGEFPARRLAFAGRRWSAPRLVIAAAWSVAVVGWVGDVVGAGGTVAVSEW